MALPLPRVVADVGPGGGLVTAMGGMNALANANILRQINEIKRQYAPTTMQAEAASKLAYANLMGPQFLAKLLQNPGAIANMGDPAAKAALQKAVGAGMGQGSGSNIFGQMQQQGQQQGGGGGIFSGIGQPSTNSLSGLLVNKVKNLFSPQQQMPQPGIQQGQQAINPFANPMQQQQMPQQGMQQPQEMQEQGQQPQTAPQADVDPIVEAYNEWVESPEGKAEMAKGDAANFPDENQVLQWKANKDKQANAMNMTLTKPIQKEKTYAEKTGEQEGIVEEGKLSGKIRAKDIENLNNTVYNAENNQITLNDISDILASPTFEQIRQTPLAGHHELAYYAKEGNPEQQQMVGKYYTLTGNLIKDASRDFAGQFRKGEQQLLNGMKPGPSDTVDSAKGKTETLSVLNKMLAERSRLTSKLMSEYHINKLAASEAADKKVNGAAIRKEIHDRLNPKRINPSNDDIDFTAKKYGMTRDQVINRLKSEGKYNG